MMEGEPVEHTSGKEPFIDLLYIRRFSNDFALSKSA